MTTTEATLCRLACTIYNDATVPNRMRDHTEQHIDQARARMAREMLRAFTFNVDYRETDNGTMLFLGK